MNILVINAGSSSLRFGVIAIDLEAESDDAERRLASGSVERLGDRATCVFQREGKNATRVEERLPDHRAALGWVLSQVGDPAHGIADIAAVGHRVVHGGARFVRSVRIDDEVLSAIKGCADLAPLQNHANIEGVEAVRAIGVGVPQVAVFDTAFHATMPEAAHTYAIPADLCKSLGIRRYGFHGTSHRYVLDRYRRALGKDEEDVSLITLHLGNGCSACAIERGRSVDTSMGFTPLEGLVMGTRCGDLDPSIVQHLMERGGMSIAEVSEVLNERSGLLGLSGISPDMRDLLAVIAERDDPRAKLALEVFCERVRKYIGAYFVRLNGPDAVVFTGGIGENSAPIRARIGEGLECIGLKLDTAGNERVSGRGVERISADGSRLAAYVIPTDEELMIARDTAMVLGQADSGD